MPKKIDPLPVEFDDIRRKLWRAHQHAKAFNSAAKKFWKGQPYAGKADLDRQGRACYRVKSVRPHPPELGIYIGDCAHQLRSSLDHLMWLLAKPLPKEEEKVQFPITTTRKRFLGTKYMTPGVPRGVRTVLESLQPYHRRRWPQTAVLGELRVISNRDKHRSLTTVGATVAFNAAQLRVGGHGPMMIPPRTDQLAIEVFTGRILKPNAILLRWKVPDPGFDGQMYVKPVPIVIPEFDERMPREIRRRPVFDTLEDCRRFIRNDVLPRFARFF